jgi:MFS family permease
MPIIKSIAGWRPHPPFFYGWLLLGACLLATFAGAGLTQQVLGGIQTIISDDTGWSRSQLALAATAGSWTAGALTPLVGRLSDRYGPRALMPTAALIAGVACISLAGANSLWQFYLPFIIGRALVNSTLIGIVPRVVAVNFFNRRRGLALGISSMGRPVGSALNIQIMSVLAVFIGWRASYRYYLGIFSLLLVVPLALIMRHKPEDIGLHQDGDTSYSYTEGAPDRHGVPEPQPTGKSTGYDWRPGEAVKTRCFWIMGIAIALETLTIGVVQFQVVPYLLDSGLSVTVAAGALSASSLLGAGSAMVWGHMADRFHPRSLALVASASGTAIMFLIMVSGGGWQAFALLLLLGSFQGGLEVMGSSIIAQYYGRASFGSIMSLFSPSTLMFLGLGPTLGALLIEATGGFTVLFVLGTVTHSLIFLAYYNARAPRLPPRAYDGSQAVQQQP